MSLMKSVESVYTIIMKISFFIDIISDLLQKNNKYGILLIGRYTIMEGKEVANLIQNIEKEKAKNKIEYWKTAGVALLDNNELGIKWCVFVEQQANNDFVRGALLDETLQIMSMIKLGVSPEIIAQTVKQIPSGQTILDAYLGAFIHPEFLFEIQTHIDSKKL